jgi:hypothetical protein
MAPFFYAANRMRAFPMRENALLTLIPGRCIEAKIKILNFLCKMDVYEEKGIFITFQMHPCVVVWWETIMRILKTIQFGWKFGKPQKKNLWGFRIFIQIE